jgi:hypothetical protein
LSMHDTRHSTMELFGQVLDRFLGPDQWLEGGLSTWALVKEVSRVEIHASLRDVGSIGVRERGLKPMPTFRPSLREVEPEGIRPIEREP